MSPKSIVCSAAIIAAMLPGIMFAAAPAATPTTTTPPATAPAAPTGRGGRGGAPAVPNGLGQAMREMNGMLQEIKKVAVDPAQVDQALKDLATFERDVAICKLLVPPQVASLGDAKDKAAALVTYRSMMNSLTKTALALEDAVNDKKADDIKKLLTQLEEIEKQGHAEFNK